MDLARRFLDWKDSGSQPEADPGAPAPPAGFGPRITPHGRALTRTLTLERNPQWLIRHPLKDLVLIGGGEVRSASWEHALVLDLETTGLGGAGTLPFLAGMAAYEPDEWRATQYFLAEPSDEAALLSALGEHLRSQTVLITYNGKAFDWHLLLSRFIQNRLNPPPSPRAHVDLLHLVRRLYRDCLTRCSLAVAEEGLLGFGRKGDVPSSEIPALYFSYLASGDSHLLEPVLEHNLQDLESTLLIAGRILRGIGREEGPGEDPEAWARLWRERGRPERARTILERICRENPASEPRGYRARMDLGFLLKSLGRFESMARLFTQALENPDPLRGITPRIELAKHLEHRRKDFRGALDLTEECLAIARRRQNLLGRAVDVERILHRRHRLLRRLGSS